MALVGFFLVFVKLISAQQYLGCFADGPIRDLPVNPLNSATIQTCAAACSQYRYFGLQYGGQCYCGNRYGSLGGSTSCNMACSAASSQTCGGSYVNSVYANAQLYIGCFQDAAPPNRDLPYYAGDGATVASCAALCSSYVYFGLQYGGQCWCGNRYGTLGVSSSCSMPCNANSLQTCGNGYVNNVYARAIPQYLGCYTDNPTRDLTNYLSTSKQSIESCANLASSSYPFFALQNGGECYADKRYGIYGPSTSCTATCTQNSAQICGNGYVNSVFTYGFPQYLGCFADSNARDLPFNAYGSGATIQSCAIKCSVNNYRYFGLQDGGNCWCGNRYGSLGTSTACTSACTANSNQICGGPWTNSIYTFGSFANYGDSLNLLNLYGPSYLDVTSTTSTCSSGVKTVLGYTSLSSFTSGKWKLLSTSTSGSGVTCVKYGDTISIQHTTLSYLDSCNPSGCTTGYGVQTATSPNRSTYGTGYWKIFGGTTGTCIGYTAQIIIQNLYQNYYLDTCGYTSGYGLQTSPTSTRDSTSGTWMLISALAQSSVSGSSSPTTTVYGQTVSLIATFTPNTPTGQVTFLEGSTTLGTTAISNGVATLVLTSPSLNVGVHTITISYGGDSNFLSTSTAFNLTITNANWIGPHTLSGLAYAAVNGPNWALRIQEINGATQPACVTACSANAGCRAALWRSAWECVLFGVTCGQDSYGQDGCASWDSSAYYYQPTVQAIVSASVSSSTFGQSVTLSATVSSRSPSSGVPTGNVNFKVGSSVVCTNVALINGVASCSITTSPVGSNSIVASYLGSTNFVAITSSNSVTLTVTKGTPIAAITFSPNPSPLGQAFTCTATFSTVGGVYPTGQVSFYYGSGNSLGVATINSSNGIASFTLSSGIVGLAVGSVSIYVTYPGDGNFNSFQSTTATQTISKGSTSVVVNSSTNPSTLGQSITITATLSPKVSIYPSGQVTFLDGTSSVGTGNLNSNGVASLSISSLVAGSRSITASYSGDANFLSASSSAISQTVTKGTVSIAVSSSLGSPVYGQPFTLTGTATAISSIYPSGQVTFLDGTSTLGTATFSSTGVATLSITTLLNVGVHSINASYPGDANFLAGQFSFSQTISNALWIGPHSMSGTASVSVNGPYWGYRIQEISGNPSQAACVAACSANSGCRAALWRANWECVLFAQICGQNTANQDGCATWDDSAYYYQPLVNTVVTASSSSIPLNQYVNFTATVSARSPSSGTPTGTVTFVNAPGCGSASLVNGQALCTTRLLPGGSNDIFARYNGDTNFVAYQGNSVSVTVAQATTSIQVTSSLSNPNYGQSVTLTATLSSVGTFYPTGDVSFVEGSNSLGSATLNANGVASLSISTLTAGSHSITASYAGDRSFVSAQSTALTQIVSTGSTSIEVASSLNPASPSDSITFSATASPINNLYPTGDVTFFDGTTSLGVETLDSNGYAELTVSPLSLGSHSITASYGGDGNFVTTQSTALEQVVSPGLDFHYIGCFADSSTRDLPFNAYGTGATIQTCASQCSINNYSYFGLQDGGNCWCGNSYGSLGTSTACTSTCTANSNQICGGPWANSLYRLGNVTNFALTAIPSIECAGGQSTIALCGDITLGLDDNLSTRWAVGTALASTEEPVIVQLDLGVLVQIDNIVITWENNHATQYQIQFSSDNIEWVDGPSENEIDGDTTNNSQNVVTYLGFGSNEYRYVKLSMYDGYCCEGVHTQQFSFWELAINGIQVS